MKQFSILLTSLFLLLLTSCSDPCAEVNCGSNGICMDGLCECDEGYEGENCETELRAKFIGDWETNNYTCGAAGGVNIIYTIIAGPTINDLIWSIKGSTLEFPATFSDNIITIPLKQYDSTTLQGIITLNSEDKLEFELIIDNSIAILNCTATASRI